MGRCARWALNSFLLVVIIHAAHADSEVDEEVVRARELVRPNIGMQLIATASAFNGGMIAPTQMGVPSQGMAVELEYQPAFLQRLGVIGIGPSASFFPTEGNSPTSGNPVTAIPFAIWSFGGQARYQLRFFQEQMIVPFVAYEMQILNYAFIYGDGGHMMIQGGSAGILFLMNAFDQAQADELFSSSSISRSYLVMEAKSLAGSLGDAHVSGPSLYFGVRFEL